MKYLLLFLLVFCVNNFCYSTGVKMTLICDTPTVEIQRKYVLPKKRYLIPDGRSKLSKYMFFRLIREVHLPRGKIYIRYTIDTSGYLCDFRAFSANDNFDEELKKKIVCFLTEITEGYIVEPYRLNGKVVKKRISMPINIY